MMDYRWQKPFLSKLNSATVLKTSAFADLGYNRHMPFLNACILVKLHMQSACAHADLERAPKRP